MQKVFAACSDIGFSFLRIMFWNLGQNSFRDLDEAMFVQVSKEVVTSGDWLTLHLRGEPFFHKPPLKIWLNSVIFSIFGINEFNARFLSALSGLIIVLLIYYFIRNIYGAATGFLASLILILSPQFLYERCCRSAEEDALVVLFFYAVFYFFWKSRKRQSYIYLSSIFIGLIFLAKSMASLLPIFSIMFFLLITKEYRLYSIKTWVFVFLLVAIIILPWHIAQFFISGENFFKIYLGEMIYFLKPSYLLRNNFLTNFITSPVIQRIGQRAGISPLCDSWYYLRAIIVGFYPWSIIFTFAVAYSIISSVIYCKSKGDDSKFRILILSWFFVPLTLLSLLYIKRVFRTNIIYPAMAIILAKFFIDSLRIKKNRAFLIVSIISTTAILANSAIIQYGIPRHTFCAWLDYYFGNFLLPNNILLRFNNPHPVIGISTVILLLFPLYFLLKKSREQIIRIGAFLLLALMIFIAGFNCFFLVWTSTYKSDMYNTVRYIETLPDPSKELIVWEDNLYRIHTEPFNTFPSEYDKWGDYYYLNNNKNITPKFIQEYAQLLEMLRKNKTFLLLTDKDKLQKLRNLINEKKIKIVKMGASLVLLEFMQSDY